MAPCPPVPTLLPRARHRPDPSRRPRNLLPDEPHHVLENAFESALFFLGKLATIVRKSKGPIELGLRPFFDLRQNEDGYAVSCFTPWLKKEDLHAEFVGTDALPALVVRGESKEKVVTPPDAKDAGDANERSSFVRIKYQNFEERRSPPADVDQVRSTPPLDSSFFFMQENLAYKKTHPPWTLPHAYA